MLRVMTRDLTVYFANTVENASLAKVPSLIFYATNKEEYIILPLADLFTITTV